jgi:hypothetical protein
MNVSPDSRVCVLYISAGIERMAALTLLCPVTGGHPDDGVGFGVVKLAVL